MFILGEDDKPVEVSEETGHFVDMMNRRWLRAIVEAAGPEGGRLLTDPMRPRYPEQFAEAFGRIREWVEAAERVRCAKLVCCNCRDNVPLTNFLSMHRTAAGQPLPCYAGDIWLAFRRPADNGPVLTTKQRLGQQTRYDAYYSALLVNPERVIGFEDYEVLFGPEERV